MKKYLFLLAIFAFITFIFIPVSYPADTDRGAVIASTLKYFPKNLTVEPPSSKLSDKEFLEAIAKDTWKFFDNSVYGRTGFIPDKIFIKKKKRCSFYFHNKYGALFTLHTSGL